MNARFQPVGLIGFATTAVFSVVQQWSLTEFCWSTWLTGLVFAWACVIAAVVHFLWKAKRGAGLLGSIPQLTAISPPVLHAGLVTLIVAIGLGALKLYSILFGFYGLFLSVFAEMEPHSLFGRNGFINSDFFTPVVYLVTRFWPMALSTLVASVPDLVRSNPWKRIAMPMESEVVRMHFMVILLPIISMVAWALFGAAYERVTVVLLIGLFFLLPARGKRKETRTAPEFVPSQ